MCEEHSRLQLPAVRVPWALVNVSLEEKEPIWDGTSMNLSSFADTSTMAMQSFLVILDKAINEIVNNRQFRLHA